MARDATFVDDEALVLLARSPLALDAAMNIMLQSLVEIFSRYGLIINWMPGKTEAMIKYRGKDATKHLESKRVDGKLCVRLPSHASAQYVTVVDKYKHVGSITSISSSDIYEVQHRCAEALAVYGPIAYKVFGSPKLGDWLKLHLMKSLVLSKMLYCIHTLTMTSKGICKLNTVYMRVLRRITGTMRFSKDCELSDLEVRRLSSQPSIDCLLVRGRLRYLKRMCRHSNQALYIITCMRRKGVPIPWVAQIRSDLATLRRHVQGQAAALPDDTAPLEAWASLFNDRRAWESAVESIFFVESVSDKFGAQASQEARLHVCTMCPQRPDGTRPGWASERALQSHMRSKHKCLSDYRHYVNEDGRCPICKTIYNTRIRCLAHITDRRRPRCAQAIDVGGATKLAESTVLRLDEADRAQRREAQRQGSTHPVAQGPAIRSDGRIVGRVTK